MHLEITSTHKNSSGLDITNFRVGFNELYTFPNNNVLNVRGNVYRVDENDVRYPIELLSTDPLQGCVYQDSTVQEWAGDETIVTLTGTKYTIAATLFFGLIIGKITAVNAETPNTISYTISDVPTSANKKG